MRNRNCRVKVYLTPEELQALARKVKSTSMTREAYLRALITGKPPVQLRR